MSEVVSQILDAKAPAAPETTGIPSSAVVEPKVNPDDRVSSKLEVLIRREQAAVQRERVAKEKEAALEARELRFKEFESAKDGNSKKALELLGLNYDELTQSLLKDGDIPPEVQIKKVEERMNTFLKSQEEAEQKRLESQKQEAAAKETKVIADFKSEINQHLTDNASRYELIKFEGQEDLVFDVIDEHYTRTIDEVTGIGKIMTIAEAADKVEQHLEQKYEKAKSLSKVSTLFGAVPKGLVKNAVEQKTKLNSQPPKTLTNNLTATPTKPKTRAVTDEDRIQRAIAYAKNLRR